MATHSIILLLLLILLQGTSRAQEITGFSLVNTVTDSFLVTLNNGDAIGLATFGDQISIRADTTGSVGSVRFSLDGVSNFRTENVAPYALSGDAPTGNYLPNAELTKPGNHIIIATIFSGTSGGGNLVTSRTLTVTTVAAPTQNPPLGGDSSDIPGYNHGPNGVLNGELKKWHKVTIGFSGPTTSEGATPNPFTDYRLEVTFSHGNSERFTVPGYYAADGNAANTGASSGNVWLVHFTPNQVGTWSWSCSFRKGTNVAQNGGGSSAGFVDGKKGQFAISSTDKLFRDHRRMGRLEYVGEHHLQFQETGTWFLKAGADSPENFLSYNDFDNTPNYGNRRKDWAPHLIDYRDGDPTWAGGKGKSIIGAINYLALEKGMNVFSFLPMNIAGDDKNAFPYVSDSPGGDRQRIDVSKTAQWEVVFDHADHIGLYLHFKTQEQENDQLLDGGALGLERKLYYRELIARFSHHLALNWNIGEENTNTDTQRKEFADFIKALDPYDSPIVVHTFPSSTALVYTPLLDYPSYDGISIQSNPSNVFAETLYWVEQSSIAGRKWVVANDEQGSANNGVLPDENDPDHDNIRKNVLWANLMAGGAGVEYYFGYRYPNSDLTCNDFRSRDKMWTQSKYALNFFNLYVPFWSMRNRNALITSGNAWCLANDEIFVVYLKDGGTATITLPPGTHSVAWFDPRNGSVEKGSVKSVSGSPAALGNPPNSPDKDWVVLVKNPESTFSLNVCFAADSMVEVQHKGKLAIQNLEIGDWVRTAEGTFERVYSFGHYDNTNKLVKYLQIHSVGAEKPLEVSSYHLVFRNGVAVPASLLSVGDMLHLVNDEFNQFTEVLDIKTVWRRGAFAPFTASGTIAVNGIAASSFISLQPDSHVVKLGGTLETPLTMQWLAHTFESAHRLVCRFHFEYCASEKYTQEGLSSWVAKPLRISRWILTQNLIMVVLLSIPALLILTSIRVLEMSLSAVLG